MTDIPKSVGKCPKANPEGQFYQENNQLSPPNTMWSWHPLPYSGLSGMVEVIHRKDPWGDEHSGAWFFYAKGSGIWFDIGKTKVFTDHGDGYKFFNAKGGNEDMCTKAAKQGYDSIQFLAHSDGGDYGDCRKNKGTPYLNIEIVATKLVGENTCASNNGKSPLLKTGWKGSKGTCQCDNGKDNLNCAGVPEW